MRRRQQLIWSQAELARRLGVDQSMLWRWEHGVTEPDAEQVAMLGEVLTAAEQEFAAVDRDRLARIETLLHATRERLAFSRSEMARRLGVDRDTYVAWEDRRRPVSSGRRRGVLAALDQLEAAASAAGEPAPAA